MDFIYAHLCQHGLSPGSGPPLQISEVDRSDRARGQPEMPGHLARRGALACLAHCVLEPFAERRLAGQLRHPLDLDAAVRTTHPVHFDNHRCSEFHARQIAYFSLAHIVRRFQFPAASGANQLPIPALPAYPKLERLSPLINLVPVDSIAWPPQQLRQIVVSQTAECTGIAALPSKPIRPVPRRIPAQNPKMSYFNTKLFTFRNALILATFSLISFP